MEWINNSSSTATPYVNCIIRKCTENEDPGKCLVKVCIGSKFCWKNYSS